ncbi:hypothetical protein [Streptomyces virginiae]|uniref:hypothetical protein n=1 Tax=Streptomyces virginiae TaxID=1961 RepID=UPI003434B7D3
MRRNRRTGSTAACQAEWLPPTATYHCAYVIGWVETKLRWDLAADDREREALLGLAEDCPDATVTYETVPADAK